MNAQEKEHARVMEKLNRRLSVSHLIRTQIKYNRKRIWLDTGLVVFTILFISFVTYYGLKP